MRTQDGKIESAPKGITNIKTEYLEKEFYRQHEEPRILTIPGDKWTMAERVEEHYIRPRINHCRGNALRALYLQESDIDGYRGINLTKPIDQSEINIAVDQMANKNKYGGDSIDAEVFKKNGLYNYWELYSKIAKEQTKCLKNGHNE